MDTSNDKKFESLVVNNLSAPRDATHVGKKTFNAFQNTSLPMPSTWSRWPGVVTWTVSVYAYLVNDIDDARFIFLHSGTTETFVNSVDVKHYLINKTGSGGFEKHLPRALDEHHEASSSYYSYKIDFTETIDLIDNGNNPISFSPKYQDEFTRFGFVQTGEFSSSSASWTLKKAPGHTLCDNPSTNTYSEAIHGLSVFQCPKKADGNYTFALSVDAGALAITQDIVVPLT